PHNSNVRPKWPAKSLTSTAESPSSRPSEIMTAVLRSLSLSERQMQAQRSLTCSSLGLESLPSVNSGRGSTQVTAKGSRDAPPADSDALQPRRPSDRRTKGLKRRRRVASTD